MRAWEGVDVLARSDDGRLLVDQGEKSLQVRDTATGRMLWRLDVENPLDLAVFSPDRRRLLLWRYDKPVGFALHETATGKRLGFVETTGSSRPEFSPDGKLVACAENPDAVHLHDTTTGRRTRTLRPARPLPRDRAGEVVLSFSPGGERLAVTGYPPRGAT